MSLIICVLILLFPSSTKVEDRLDVQLYNSCYEYIIKDLKLNKNTVAVSPYIIYLDISDFSRQLKKDAETLSECLHRLDSITWVNKYDSFYSFGLDSLFSKVNKRINKECPFRIVYFTKVLESNVVLAEVTGPDCYTNFYETNLWFGETFEYLFFLDENRNIIRMFKIGIING